MRFRPTLYRSTLTLLATFALWTAFERVAHADDDAVSKAAILAREAEKLEADGKYAEACIKLDQSQQYDPRGETLLDLALCREKEGKIGTAYNLFEAAEKAASTEKRSDRSATAKQHRNALFAKVPHLTVIVPKEAETKGLEITAGGQIVPESEWGKAYAVDSGAIKVTASAPQKETWETVLEAKVGAKKSVTVPVLKPGNGPPPKTLPDVPINSGSGGSNPPPGGNMPPGSSGSMGNGSNPGGGAPPPPEGHRAHRIVVDFGLQVGLHLSVLQQAPQGRITGTQYKYSGDGGSEFLASCGDTVSVPGAGTCNATFKPQPALLVGGQFFMGYAFTESVQFGGRVFAGAHIPIGYEVLGGPSISFKVSKPFWMGVTALVGTTQVKATVTGARGSVPKDLRSANDSSSQVKIPVGQLAGGLSSGKAVAPASGRVEVGGALEISGVLVDVKRGITGSLMASAWPTAVYAQGGVVFAVPIGLSYRFY